MSEQFTSRWGLVLAMLGMAVGTGNIWRFPRIVATNGGGSFLVAWVCFLLLWSVPLMMIEFSFGKHSRSGTVGAFAKMAGEKFAWMGGWVALCATAIMFYYSVVAGWCLRYLTFALTGGIGDQDPAQVWQSYTSSFMPTVTHVIALTLGVSVVWFGVRGIERVAKVIIPTLFGLVVILALRALTLPGASRGLEFLFKPDWSMLADVNIWLQALTQNAWDTGAGWGLILTYAIYMRVREDVPLNAFMIGFGNNSVSLLAGIMVLCTVFAIQPDARDQIVGAGNEGLTFIWMPQLFAAMPAGGFFMVLFFLGLSFAALTSLISMIELASRVLMDAGFARRRAVITIGVAALVLGLPSAYSIDFLHNQDWVWGVGLMISGLFFAIGARQFGLEKMRKKVINGDGSDIHVGKWWTTLVAFVVPVEAALLTVWWLWQARRDFLADHASRLEQGLAPVSSWGEWGWLHPISAYNVGTVLAQFAVAITVLLLLNRWLARKAAGSAEVAR
jgi:NSS family neurotransmitter:Na+ symporter